MFPPAADVFNALHLTSYADTRVVILGQDPYHGPHQAHGLCFSVRLGLPVPPSLANMYKELRTDVVLSTPHHCSLLPSPTPGGLFPNTTPTFLACQPGHPPDNARERSSPRCARAARRRHQARPVRAL